MRFLRVDRQGRFGVGVGLLVSLACFAGAVDVGPAGQEPARKAAETLPPGEPRVHYDAAVEYQKKDRLDAALAEIEKALALAPAVSEYHGLRGDILKRKLRFEEAEAAYRRMLELARSPSHPVAGFAEFLR